jgi:hypothetical protein
MIISIDKADYLGEYRIKFSFSDGVERIIELKVHLTALFLVGMRKFCSFTNKRAILCTLRI